MRELLKEEPAFNLLLQTGQVSGACAGQGAGLEGATGVGEEWWQNHRSSSGQPKEGADACGSHRCDCNPPPSPPPPKRTTCYVSPATLPPFVSARCCWLRSSSKKRGSCCRRRWTSAASGALRTHGTPCTLGCRPTLAAASAASAVRLAPVSLHCGLLAPVCFAAGPTHGNKAWSAGVPSRILLDRHCLAHRFPFACRCLSHSWGDKWKKDAVRLLLFEALLGLRDFGAAMQSLRPVTLRWPFAPLVWNAFGRCAWGLIKA